MPSYVKLSLVFFLGAACVVFSYVNAEQLSTLFERFRYVTVKHMNARDALDSALAIRDEHEKTLSKTPLKREREILEEKFNTSFNHYLDTMVRVYPLPVDPNKKSEKEYELHRYAGAFFIDRGDYIKGVNFILESVDAKVDREEMPYFIKAIGTLYAHGMFSDIVAECSVRNYGNEGDIHFWYGFALYKTGTFADAYRELVWSLSARNTSDEHYFALSKCSESIGKRDDAILYSRRALDEAPRNTEYRLYLIDLLAKSGRTKEAEKETRKLR